MANIIQIKRAAKESLLVGKNNLAVGELAIALDTKNLFVGTMEGNAKVDQGMFDAIKKELLGDAEDTSADLTIYGVKKYAEEQVANAGSDVLDDAKAYTDEQIEALNISQYATIMAMTEAISAAKTDLIGTGSGTAETIKGVYDEAKTYVDQQVAAHIGSAYKAGGSVAFEELPVLEAANEGKVYNISNAFTTTEDFVEGAGQKYPAGSNVVCIDVGEDTFKWDVLSGVVDLSAYDTAEVAQGKIDAAKQAAIDAAAADATAKANTAEQNAKTYADNLNTAMDARVNALETDVIKTVTPGDGIEIGEKSGNVVTVSAKVVAANGLSVDSNGIAMAQGSADVFGTVRVDGITMKAVGGVISVAAIDGGEITE